MVGIPTGIQLEQNTHKSLFMLVNVYLCIISIVQIPDFDFGGRALRAVNEIIISLVNNLIVPSGKFISDQIFRVFGLSFRVMKLYRIIFAEPQSPHCDVI